MITLMKSAGSLPLYLGIDTTPHLFVLGNPECVASARRRTARSSFQVLKGPGRHCQCLLLCIKCALSLEPYHNL